MKFHTLIALSEFDARFDDAMARRPFLARRQGDHGSPGKGSPEDSPGHPDDAPAGPRGLSRSPFQPPADGDDKWAAIASARSRLGDGLNPTVQHADGDVSLKSMPYQPADGDVELTPMPYRPAGGEAVLKPMPYRPGDPDAGMDGRYGAVDRADFIDQLEEQPEAPSSRKAQMFRNWSAIASERSRLGDGLNPTVQPADGDVSLSPNPPKG